MCHLQNFITRDDIIAYAEEGGDFAQLKEVDSFMEVREEKAGELKVPRGLDCRWLTYVDAAVYGFRPYEDALYYTDL